MRFGEVLTIVEPFFDEDPDVTADSEFPMPLPEGADVDRLRVLLEEFDTRNFNIVDAAEIVKHPLTFFAWEAFKRHDLLNKMNIPAPKLVNYFRTVESYYLPNPYHNATHAADVMQAVHVVLCRGFEQYLTTVQVCAILWAAVVHDVGHDGVNNNYHVMSQSDRAMQFNDQSVQENYHCFLAFKILKLDNCNFMETQDPKIIGEIRKALIQMVCHTDMVQHAPLLSNINKLKEEHGTDLSQWKDITPMINLVLHQADVSNPTRLFDIARIWSMRCLKEFWNQGEREEQKGFPISPMCDEKTCNVPGSQIGFIKFIVLPTLKLVVELLPGMQPSLDNLNTVLATWEQEKANEEALKAQLEDPGTSPS